MHPEETQRWVSLAMADTESCLKTVLYLETLGGLGEGAVALLGELLLLLLLKVALLCFL